MYKRLNYGTKSAGDIFQKWINEELTQYILGVINISDDIPVTGKDQQEHDERLEAFLETAREKKRYV
jgi:6-phosphogluconate dehydrogenase